VLPAGSEVTMVTWSAGQVLPLASAGLAGTGLAGAITHAAAAVLPRRARRLSKLSSLALVYARSAFRRGSGAARRLRPPGGPGRPPWSGSRLAAGGS
jgi:hypothetical protein